MEELTTDENHINLKEGKILENKKVAEESQLSNNEKPKENKGITELEIVKETVKQNRIPEGTDKIVSKKIGSQVPSQNIQLQKRDGRIQAIKRKKERIKVLKRKRTEDGATIERVLSPGEISPGYETVSSINSSLDFEDLDLSYSESELDYNVIVQIENELALENFYRSNEREIYWEGRNDSMEKCYNRPKHFLGKYTNQRHNGYNNYGRSEYWRRDTEDRQQRFYGSERWLRENEDYHYSRQQGSPGGGWSKCDGSSRVSRGSVCSSHSRQSRGSAYGDLRSLREGKMRDSRRSRSSEHCYRDSRSPSFKVRKTEFRGSSSSYKSHSYSNRNLQFKRTAVPSSASVWERLDNSPRNRFKENKSSKNPKRFSKAFQSKKRDGTIPFLVELGRRLKEAENLGFPLKEESAADSAEYTESANEATLIPEPVISQTPNDQSSSQYISPMLDYSAMYSIQYPPVTTMSVENLPLVPGPAGLPVHVTMTGEQIPHDVDGRRIPVGPNGSYLPLDPSGRLFAHIVSPRNQAVPIHMTDDGVIRLPNSEPVPYGPSHNFPVNIDGSTIYLGPDSKPLGPCPNLPREPPLEFLKMMQTEVVDFSSDKNLIKQEYTETPVPESVELESEVCSEVKHSESAVNPSKALLDFTQNPCAKADLLNNYQKRFEKKSSKQSDNRKIGKSREQSENNVEARPSRDGVKRSTPMKFIQRKTFKDSSDLETITDSSDSDSSCDVASLLKLQKDNGSSKPLPSESKSEDFIVKKVQQALKSFTEENFKPPAAGRFILSAFTIDNGVETTPNLSPLSRTRTKLPFILPGAAASGCSKEEPKAVEESAVTFRFLSEENSLEMGEMTRGFDRTFKKMIHSTKLPALSFDFAVQCDFTFEIINNMSSKIAELEMEVVRLRNIKANLSDGFRNVHEMNERKDEELRKALLDIEIKNNEILRLKQLNSEKEK